MSPQKNWKNALMAETTTIRDAILTLEKIGTQIIMVVDKDLHLIGTLSDGDIRRGLLRGLRLDNIIESIIHRNPLVVNESISRNHILQLMLINKVHQIPILNKKGKLCGLHLWDEMNDFPKRQNTIVVMAGGKGLRLRPLTEFCPKPMLNVAGKPLLEHILLRSKAEGFSMFIFSINYLGHLIEDYFKSGINFDVSIKYLKEKTALGTAGSLTLLPKNIKEPIIVTNGDVLTNIRYGEILDFHSRHNAIATMAISQNEWQNPYGIVKTNGSKITGFEEKPISRFNVNAGVYVLSPSALSFLEYKKNCDMPNLFERIRLEGLTTLAYPLHEQWLDVGRPEDFAKAVKFISI